MNDVAIFDNHSDGSGGGISTCTTGTAEVGSHGAAIFNNTASAISADNPNASKYSDIYAQCINHQNIDGDDIPGGNGFQHFDYELYELMFNNGLHNWEYENYITDYGQKVYSLIAKSNPTNTDTSNAKVIFKNNAVYKGAKNNPTGGAISCNGLLRMGTDEVEFKVIKLWDDNGNNDGYRPDLEVYTKLVKSGKLTVKNDTTGEVADLTSDDVTVEIIKASEFHNYRTNIFDLDAKEDQELIDIVNDNPEDTYLVIVCGLPKLEKGQKYIVVDDDVEKYVAELYPNVDRAIINKHIDETLKINGTKIWEDNDNLKGFRPESITINLLADGEKVDSVTTTEKQGWKFEFKNLPRYKDGKEIIYTLEEKPVKGYEDKLVLDSTTVEDNRTTKVYKLINSRVEEKYEIPKTGVDD